MMNEKTIDFRVSDQDWQRMAKHAGIPAEELKAKVLDALASPEAFLARATPTTPVISGLTAAGDQCQSQSFEVSLFKIIGVAGTLTLCGTNTSDWSAELQVCLVVAGSKVWCTTYKFDPHNLGVCFSPSVGIAKAKLCFTIQIKNNSACLNISGNACVWGFGWKCGDFDTTVFCIPLP
jgi:hypothetical protein